MSAGEDRSLQPGAANTRSSALGRYHPGLDGMRGLATLVVLAYHAQIAWARGAFLAVSQFFTLSGFLITGLLMHNHLGPGQRLGPFWARRMRRLVPAALIALVIVVIYGATIATRAQTEDLPVDILSAATWSANWRFILSGTSYFELFTAPSPVQHFWSLAVEEQFYLLLPLVLVLVLRWSRSHVVLVVTLLLAAVASTIWMFVLYRNGATLDRLYYGTDTRLAEMLTGAALAVVVWNSEFAFPPRVRRRFATIGLVAFVVTMWSWVNVPLADGLVWQGGFLLFSLTSCALILGAVAGTGPVAALLSWSPLAWAGRISYGLYLYHFPVYLWLTEDRTGLDKVPLVALRLFVSFSLAAASYYLVERPILRGASLGLQGRGRYVLGPLGALLVVAVAFAAIDDDAPDPLATLRTDNASLATPPRTGDGMLDLVVIPGRGSDPVIERLAALARADDAVSLQITEPFECNGVTDVTGQRTCASWASSWPTLVEEHDPDVVLLYVDAWQGEELGELARQMGTDEISAATQVLDAGFDILTSRGASVVWASSGTNFAERLRRAEQPFYQAMGRIEHQRTDFFKLVGTRLPDATTTSQPDFVEQSASVLLDDAGLYNRRDAEDLTRVMVVGDSQARSLGYGLERWGAEKRRALVWNIATEGCGLANAGTIEAFGATDTELERCRDALSTWPQQIASFDPDIVVVLSGVFDVRPRRLEDWTDYKSIGDPEFDEYLAAEYERALEALTARGANIVWLRAPCTELATVVGQPADQSPGYDPEVLAYLNDVILGTLARANPDRMALFPLDDVICPGGDFLESVDGVDDLRPDGIHFSVDGSLWFAENYGDDVLRLGSP